LLRGSEMTLCAIRDVNAVQQKIASSSNRNSPRDENDAGIHHVYRTVPVPP